MNDDINTYVLISVAEDDIFTCLFRLILQRSYAAFNFSNNILNSLEIIRCGSKLPFSLSLSTLIQNYPRSFLKYLSAILRFSADNFLNLTLSNNRVSVNTYSGVHKQLFNVSQSALVTVYQIFTLTRSIHTTSNLHFVILKRQY